MNWTKIADDLRKVRAENEIALTVRRGDEELEEQPARVEYVNTRGFRVQSDAAREARQAVVVLGEPDMDVAVEDRFTHEAVLYRVVFIQPNRLAATLAEAVAVL
jgi:hypothetical protein